MWLPPQEDAGPDPIYCVREHNCEGVLMEYSRYCHPALVLELYQRPGSNVEGDLMCLVTDVSLSKDQNMSPSDLDS